MATDTTYNGWTNYETWCVALWIDNDQGMQETVLEMAREDMAAGLEGKDNGVYYLGKRIEDFIDDYRHETQGAPDKADMFTDLLNAALAAVNWNELARGYLEQAREQAEYEAKQQVTA